jgi:uncharacterized membrane protein YkgB
MVLIFLASGYQKWFAYEAQVLIPFISNGPLIFWLYPVFGARGASWFLGVSERTFDAPDGGPRGVGMAMFLNLLHRWESAELNQAEAAELLGVSERTFRRWTPSS